MPSMSKELCRRHTSLGFSWDQEPRYLKAHVEGTRLLPIFVSSKRFLQSSLGRQKTAKVGQVAARIRGYLWMGRTWAWLMICGKSLDRLSQKAWLAKKGSPTPTSHALLEALHEDHQTSRVEPCF